MSKFRDLTGLRFGLLTVLEETNERQNGVRIWLCKCDCGNIVKKRHDNITSRHSQSCGCLQKKSNFYQKVDISGQKFGKLTPIEETDKRSGTSPIWICRCDCGNIVEVRKKNLLEGITRSCGCLRKEYYAQRRTHNKSRSRLYGVWHGMVNRCTNPNTINYNDYGGRGIKVCEEWLNSFQLFSEWATVNGYDEQAPRGQCTLDRIDPDGDYSPQNCRWVDMKTQINNRRNKKQS